ncbi:hypothetical protein J2S08_004200 [Bacillus chungangensis]|uniref:Uncharacterized protein n=1 Tax=Bacillus chungangensis TaxID=587633 RepID=A0ABT9WYC7_9BACI|nr:hypothetical protein [Bacillus chungangensis]
MRHNERSHQNPYIRNVKEDEQFKGRNLSKWQGDVPASLHSETVGERGPVLEQDNILHETLETFVHEKKYCLFINLSKISAEHFSFDSLLVSIISFPLYSTK